MHLEAAATVDACEIDGPCTKAALTKLRMTDTSSITRTFFLRGMIASETGVRLLTTPSGETECRAIQIDNRHHGSWHYGHHRRGGKVRASGLDRGIAQLFVQHTSCSLLLTENADPDVRRDLEMLFRRLAPDGDPAYRHDTEGADDMAAHARRCWPVAA